jgi:hypothetical protein
MTKKYEMLTGDCLSAGDRRVYRIRALRDFADVRRGDLGGYIESEENLCHEGDCWIHDVAQVYGTGAVVRDNARVRGEAWVLGRVEGDAQVCDLVVVGEDAHVGGSTILCCDEIVVESRRPLEPARPAPSPRGASRFGRQTL